MLRTIRYCILKAATLGWIVAAAAGPSALWAVDTDGNFVIRGAGQANCTEFVRHRREGGDAYVSIAGWVDGYLTANNELRERTFSVAPWQSTELLLAALAGWCEKHPTDSLHTAVFRLTDRLVDQRLSQRSEVITIAAGGASLSVPVEVLRRVQASLRLRGHLAEAPSGEFDQPTQEALRRFQAEKSLPVTGLPDQVTLANLL